MSHSTADDTVTEIAALYALGALSQQEARAFEQHLAEGCPVCRATVGEFEPLVAQLALSAAQEQTPPGLRERLIERIDGMPQVESRTLDCRSIEQPQAPSLLTSIRAGDGEWHEIMKGVLVKQLYKDEVGGTATSLVKMLPGTGLPSHRHNGVEQFFVIEGDCKVHGETLGPGDYHRAEAGSIHETTYTEHGTVFLLVAPASYDILDRR